MTRNPETLAHVGEALYGSSWRGELAAALDVSDRTLRRWLAGEFQIPEGIWGELRALCRARGQKLQKLAESL